jgi:hypothetical protein
MATEVMIPEIMLGERDSLHMIVFSRAIGIL